MTAATAGALFVAAAGCAVFFVVRSRHRRITVLGLLAHHGMMSGVGLCMASGGAFVPETAIARPTSPAASQVCAECVAEYRRARPVSVVPM